MNISDAARELARLGAAKGGSQNTRKQRKARNENLAKARALRWLKPQATENTPNKN